MERQHYREKSRRMKEASWRIAGRNRVAAGKAMRGFRLSRSFALQINE